MPPAVAGLVILASMSARGRAEVRHLAKEIPVGNRNTRPITMKVRFL